MNVKLIPLIPKSPSNDFSNPEFKVSQTLLEYNFTRAQTNKHVSESPQNIPIDDETFLDLVNTFQ